MQIWDAWHESNSPNYPHEKVIQFVLRNFGAATIPPGKALDVGCGSGANACFLAEVGFVVTGIDASQRALKNTSQRAEAEGLRVTTQLNLLSEFVVPKEVFDLVISIGVIEFVNAYEGEAAIARSYAALKPGGKALFLFAAETDFRHESRENLGIRKINRDEVRQLMAPISEGLTLVDQYITTYNNDAYRQVDWLVTVEKGALRE